MSLAEIPYQPQMTEPLQTTQRFGHPILRFKDDGGDKFGDETALPRYAEFGVKVRFYVSDNLHAKQPPELIDPTDCRR